MAATDLDDIVAYDTETSGRDTRHGQVFEFAGVRLDRNFGRLDELHLRIRRNPYVVPEPGALRVTKVDPRTLDDPSLPDEFDATRAIDAFIRRRHEGSRLFLTYNGLDYDDEILRTMMFRNMRDPFFSSGRLNYRIDVLDLVRLEKSSLRPKIVMPPADAEGRISNKLEHVALANGIGIDAHTALSDTLATVDVGRLVRDLSPWAWTVAKRNSNTALVDDAIDRARVDGTPMFRFTHYGQPDLVPCIPLARGAEKQWLMADLRKDPEDVARGIESRDAYGADKAIGVVKPSKAPYLLTLEEAREHFGMDIPDIELEERTSRIRDVIVDRQLSAAAVLERDKPFPSETSEQRIYGGFASKPDKRRMESFVLAPDWRSMAAIRFDDRRLTDFQARILCIRASSVPDLGPYEAAQWRALAAEAFARPFATGERPYATVENTHEEGDEDYRSWISETFLDPAPGSTEAIPATGDELPPIPSPRDFRPLPAPDVRPRPPTATKPVRRMRIPKTEFAVDRRPKRRKEQEPPHDQLVLGL